MKLRMENIEFLESATPGSDEYKKLLADLEKFEDIERKKEELRVKLKEAGIQHIVSTTIKAVTHDFLGLKLAKADELNPFAGKVENKLLDKMFKFMD